MNSSHIDCVALAEQKTVFKHISGIFLVLANIMFWVKKHASYGIQTFDDCTPSIHGGDFVTFYVSPLSTGNSLSAGSVVGRTGRIAIRVEHQSFKSRLTTSAFGSLRGGLSIDSDINCRERHFC